MARTPALAATTVAALLSGCTSLPDPDPTRGDCQLRAGAAILEGASEWVGQGSAQGAAVTMIGTCPETLRTFVRTESGSVVCHGDAAWCSEALREAQPLELTPAQLRELVADDTDGDSSPDVP